MVDVAEESMSVTQFLDWAEQQPGKWELHDGTPVVMSPERVVHGDVKYRIARALDDAITKAEIDCRFVLDSALVRIDQYHGFQPDALVYCGGEVDPNAVEIPNPVIVVEVLSPGNALRDLRDKLAGYFRLASIAHYLIADPDKKLVMHHARGSGSDITTRLINQGTIHLDPPGITITFESIFPVA